MIGATVAELQLARDALSAMLKADGPPPEGRFADLAVLEPVKDYPARHASTLLAFEAVLAAAREARRAGTTARTSHRRRGLIRAFRRCDKAARPVRARDGMSSLYERSVRAALRAYKLTLSPLHRAAVPLSSDLFGICGGGPDRTRTLARAEPWPRGACAAAIPGADRATTPSRRPRIASRAGTAAASRVKARPMNFSSRTGLSATIDRGLTARGVAESISPSLAKRAALVRSTASCATSTGRSSPAARSNS